MGRSKDDKVETHRTVVSHSSVMRRLVAANKYRGAADRSIFPSLLLD
jgi:hypothetical protein